MYGCQNVGGIPRSTLSPEPRWKSKFGGTLDDIKRPPTQHGEENEA